MTWSAEAQRRWTRPQQPNCHLPIRLTRSAVALIIFTMITAAHLRIRTETGASLPMLVLAIVAAAAVFVTFVFTTLIHEPASMVTLAGILVLSIGLDYGWKHGRPSRSVPVQVGP
jgi:hypothetical protein